MSVHWGSALATQNTHSGAGNDAALVTQVADRIGGYGMVTFRS
jgi:hypothetical protein